MLTENQLKAVEYQACGLNYRQISDELGVNANTVSSWNKLTEYTDELARATELFGKQVQLARTRNYRGIQKAIQNEILERIENGKLAEVDFDKLFKMLGSATLSNKQDEGNDAPSLIQNNTQINNISTSPEFMASFGKLLSEQMTPEEIVTVVEKVEKEIKRNT